MGLWMLGFAILGLLVAWGLRKCPWIASRPPGDRRGTPEEGAGGSGTGSRGPTVGSCQLVGKPSALAQALLKNFGQLACLEAGGWSWKAWPNLQTAVQFLWPPDRPLEFARDHLQLSDKGLVALDWVVGPLSGKAKAAAPGLDAAVLVVVPNATGKITRNLCQLCQLALREGCYPVIFNRRGHNGCPLTTSKLQPFGDPADLKEAVAYLRFRHPAAVLFAISEGSGSGLLLSYLGECGSSSYLRGAACLSPLLKAQEWFERETSWWYRWSCLLSQKRGISRYVNVLKEVTEVDQALRSRSLRAFEEALFCHGKGRNMTWEAYWDRNDPLRDVDEVAVPVLCLCSADDPIRGPPEDTIPWELFQSNPYFFLLLSPYGGHCGFFGEDAGTSWGHSATLEYFRTVAEFFHTEERVHRRSLCLHHRRPHPEASPPARLPLRETFSWQRSYTR
ncbi:protein ABHD15 [Pogona vitticeps]